MIYFANCFKNTAKARSFTLVSNCFQFKTRLRDPSVPEFPFGRITAYFIRRALINTTRYLDGQMLTYLRSALTPAQFIDCLHIRLLLLIDPRDPFSRREVPSVTTCCFPISRMPPSASATSLPRGEVGSSASTSWRATM